MAKGCYGKPTKRVIKEFERNKASFAVLVEYLSEFDPALYEQQTGKTEYEIGFFTLDREPGYMVFGEEVESLPPIDASVLDALAVLKKLGYAVVMRSNRGDNTIVFQMDDRLEFPLRNYQEQGITFAMEAGKPKIIFCAFEQWVDEMIPLEDEYYYWHGFTYPFSGKTRNPTINFDE